MKVTVPPAVTVGATCTVSIVLVAAAGAIAGVAVLDGPADGSRGVCAAAGRIVIAVAKRDRLKRCLVLLDGGVAGQGQHAVAVAPVMPFWVVKFRVSPVRKPAADGDGRAGEFIAAVGVGHRQGAIERHRRAAAGESRCRAGRHESAPHAPYRACWSPRPNSPPRR